VSAQGRVTMSVARRADPRLDEVLGTLSGLKGVRRVFLLDRVMRAGLEKIEKAYPSLGPLTIRNDGVFECLKREHVACIIKDRGFRPPPSPTVQLIDEDGNVIGRELLPGERLGVEREKKVIMLGEDFVIFFEKGKGKGARFVLPPVSFREVEELKVARSVCSSSPSTAGDLFLRQSADLEDDPNLASILIGFDLR
jgi:hypothetical protein